MRLGVLTDIHSNIHALEACVARGQELQVDTWACLGDVVGYNARPRECVEFIRDLAVPTIQGNHDNVAAGLSDPLEVGFNPPAEHAIRWTSEILSQEQRTWLAELPTSETIHKSVHLCHGSPRDQNEYILTALDLIENAQYVLRENEDTRVVFFGHTHLPAFIDVASPLSGDPEAEVISLSRDSLYFINPGSVGQPRDGRPESAFAIYDDEKSVIEYVRVEYDIDAVTRENEAAKIDPFLSERLRLGI